jgi:hypothetical protein
VMRAIAFSGRRIRQYLLRPEELQDWQAYYT